MPVNLSEGFYYLSSAQIRELIDVMEAFAKKHSIPDDAVPVILNAVARLALDAQIKHLRNCGATEADVQMYMNACGWTPMDAKQPSKDVN